MPNNLEVNGTTKSNGEEIGFKNQAETFTEQRVIYSANSVSTGNKNLALKDGENRYKFSEFKAFTFGEIATATESHSWIFMSRPVFEGIGSFYVEQNIATNDRRFKMNYVSDSVFNVSYVDNGGGIIIIGYN